MLLDVVVLQLLQAIKQRKCGVDRLSVQRLWKTLTQIKQYPTLAGIYLVEYMTQQVMNAIAFPALNEIFQISVQG